MANAVTRLQDKYDVRIHFPQERTNDGVVTLRGGRKGVAQAKAEIVELLAYETENNHVDTVDIPTKAVARVVGRGGATINQIREDTDAQLDLERKDGRATLRLRGTKKAIAAAKAAISEIVERIESEETYTLSIPARFHGALIGAGGQHLKQLIVDAGGPTDAAAQAQYVRFPRGHEGGDQVTVRAPQPLGARIAERLEAEAKRLADRVVYGVIAPSNVHRQLIQRGGTRQSDWQTRLGVSVVVPNWREYAELGTPTNQEELEGAEPDTVVKLHGPADAVHSVVPDVQQLVASAARKATRAHVARIDA